MFAVIGVLLLFVLVALSRSVQVSRRRLITSNNLEQPRAVKSSSPALQPLRADGHPRRSATRDHAAIRSWAERHQAEPATGEASASGPATVNVNDYGAGIRFNFPGAASFRRISWPEWFDHFERYRLVFVSEEEESERPSRGSYYRLMTQQDWRREMS